MLCQLAPARSQTVGCGNGGAKIALIATTSCASITVIATDGTKLGGNVRLVVLLFVVGVAVVG